jgi:putative ABC transport system permease protein
MNFVEIIEESVLVLKTNKLRTALSALGIIIGIGSVITLMTLGQASQSSIKQRIQSLGSNLLIVRPGAAQEGFLRRGGGVKTLKYSDALAIAQSKRIDTVSSVAGEYDANSQVSYGRNNVSISISAVEGDYFNLRNITLEAGSPITDQDSQNLNKVAVIGPTVVTDLFGSNVNPIGEAIRINGNSFTVIGVTKSKGASAIGNADEVVYLPLETAEKVLFGTDYLSTLYVGAKNDQLMSAAENQVGFMLLELHRKTKVADADFSISSQQDILNTVDAVTQTFTTLLTGIAAISLIVGGIGVMNIMLVTVTERTSEIGLRKALGAKRKSIITQFLVEAIILTITGGVIGVIVGVGASLILTRVMSLPTTLAVGSIGLAVVVSSVIGIVFGWYPAQKASKLQPIEALRYE